MGFPSRVSHMPKCESGTGSYFVRKMWPWRLLHEKEFRKSGLRKSLPASTKALCSLNFVAAQVRQLRISGIYQVSGVSVWLVLYCSPLITHVAATFTPDGVSQMCEMASRSSLLCTQLYGAAVFGSQSVAQVVHKSGGCMNALS